MNNLKYKVIIILSLSICFQCTYVPNNDTQFNKSKVVVEGMVTDFNPMNETAEISSHGGFILKNPKWIFPPSFFTIRIFLNGKKNISTFLNKIVHVEGSLVKVSSVKITEAKWTESYNAINIDSIYVIK